MRVYPFPSTAPSQEANLLTRKNGTRAKRFFLFGRNPFIADLFFPWVLEARLELIKEFYREYSDSDGNAESDVQPEDFLHCCSALIESPWIHISRGFPPGDFRDYIYEGSQGLLLDQHYGFFPYVTRSDTGTENILKLCGDMKPEIFLITRAYQTRHGQGPMSNEHLPHNIKKNPLETNVRNRFQGEFRRSLLDLSLLEYAMQRDKLIVDAPDKRLVITCLDHIKDEYRFTRQGQIIHCDNEDDFVERIAEHLKVRTVYTSTSDDSAYINRRVV